MPKQKIDRKTLIRNSLNVFKEKGYAATSMADIATANGLLKGSIYHYVSSKEELMFEVLSALKNHYVTRIFSKAYDASTSAIERLELLAKAAEEIFLQEDTGDFFVNIGLETSNTVESFSEVIREFFSEWIDALAYLYSLAMSEAEARTRAELTVAEIEGAVILMKLMKDKNYLIRTNQNILNDFRTLVQLKANKQ